MALHDTHRGTGHARASTTPVRSPSPSPIDERGRWSVALIERSVRSRADVPESQILALFDVLDDLFRRGDRNARIFVEALATIGRGEAVTQDHADLEEDFGLLVDTLAREAALADAPGFAGSLRILLTGVVLKSIRGDQDAALQARPMAEDLVARHGSPAAAHPVAAGAWQSLDLDAYV